MRDNWLANRIVRSGNAILDHGCAVGIKLIDRPCTVSAIGLGDWALGC